MNTARWLSQQLLEKKAWKAKTGKYVHSWGCGANTSEPCLCDFPYPIPKEFLNET